MRAYTEVFVTFTIDYHVLHALISLLIFKISSSISCLYEDQDKLIQHQEHVKSKLSKTILLPKVNNTMEMLEFITFGRYAL